MYSSVLEDMPQMQSRILVELLFGSGATWEIPSKEKAAP
jgi:hypothetical protein